MLETLAFMTVLSGVMQPQVEIDLASCWSHYLDEREQALVEEVKAELSFDKQLDALGLQSEIASLPLSPRVDYSYLASLETEVLTKVQEIDMAHTQTPAQTSVRKPLHTLVSNQNSALANVPISADYRLLIPAIKVDASIVETNIYDEETWKADLLRGIGHYLANPGEGGKIFLTGHSSWWVPHPLGEVFRYLYKLKAGDDIYIDYQGERYQYKVSKQEIVGPNTPSITSNYGYEELVLVTCYPYQSWKSRLVIYANKV